MADEPTTNVEDAVRFLEWKKPGGPWPITAIIPDGGKTPTTWLKGADAVRAFVAKHSGRANLHYSVAELEPGISRKPKKENLIYTAFLHADIDPPKTLSSDNIDDWITQTIAEIQANLRVPKPSLMACSGNGLHLLWRLTHSFPPEGAERLWADVEARNRWIVTELGGDGGTWNCDRLLKLYGSLNEPNELKRKAGRVRRATYIIEMNDLAYSLSDFGALEAGTPTARPKNIASLAAADHGEIRRLADLAELEEWGIGETDPLRMLIVHGSDPEKFDGDRSKVVFRVCCDLHRRGVPPALIAGIISDEAWSISEHVRAQRGRKIVDYAWRQVQQAIKKVAAEGGVRPRIVWSEVELSRCLDEAESALIDSGLPLYQMADRLVQVVKVPRAGSDDDAVRRPSGSLVIAHLPKHRLHEHFSATARFVKVRSDKDGNTKFIPFAPPLQFAETYVARRGAWRLPVLTGIATTPTMRTDGSVVAADGYDMPSGLIIDTQGVAFPSVPSTPSADDARAALAALIDVLSEFPFVSDHEGSAPGGDQPSQSRSVALAMIITAVARPMFNAAPMFGISAPTMATGKSLLADVPAMIVTGRRATKMSQGANEEEDEKRLLSVLMQGDPVNVIDNIARPIEGDALCTILTEETWRCRLLGRSEMRDVGTRALFIATGNNLSFRNDMASRAVLASLDAELENPGERVFRRDLKSYVPQHRAELAVAALTVLRAYIAAGRPKIAGMAASRFEDWAIVRAALVWLGEPDPWATNARVSVGDEARAEHHDLMLCIAAAFGNGQFLATTDIIERAQGPDPAAQNLHQALATALPHGVSAPGLGRFLKKFSDRRVEGMWIKASPNAKRGGRYAVMTNDAFARGGQPCTGAESEMFQSAFSLDTPANPYDDAPY